MREGRSRHLVFVAHLWVFSPFMLVWVFGPGLLALSRSSPFTASLLRAFWTGALLYLVARTVLAWFDPPRLRWDYVFPPLDVALISVAIGMRGAESPHASADETLLFLYFLPIAEAASTLNVAWAATVAYFTQSER